MPAAEEIRLTEVLGVLADPVRLAIVRELAAHGEVSCGAIPLPVADSTRSHHFKALRLAGVTRSRVAGTRRMASLRRDDLERRFPGLLDAVLAGLDA